MSFRRAFEKLRTSFAIFVLSTLVTQVAILSVHSHEHRAQDIEQTQKHQSIVHDNSCGLCDQFTHAQFTLHTPTVVSTPVDLEIETVSVLNETAIYQISGHFSARAPPQFALI